MAESLESLLAEIRACRICATGPPDGLAHEPRPIVQVGSSARIVIIGQAPGRRVHESGVAWDDPSGVRLRAWLGLTTEQFYDPALVAIIPMGFCYPGSAKSGDLPPRRECAPTWHPRLLEQLSDDRLDIILGTYAQRRYLPERAPTLTETVRNWREYLPHRVVLPHPSPRNAGWFKSNPWFDRETVPSIRARVAEIVGSRYGHLRR